eukprot:3601942-Pyramimonas_sp.AAC.1
MLRGCHAGGHGAARPAAGGDSAQVHPVCGRPHAAHRTRRAGGALRTARRRQPGGTHAAHWPPQYSLE